MNDDAKKWSEVKWMDWKDGSVGQQVMSEVNGDMNWTARSQTWIDFFNFQL